MKAKKVVYAGFGKRLLAALLDFLILGIIRWGFGSIVDGLVGLLISWLYYAIQESSANQGTIGKQALGIVVTNLSNNRISFLQATMRFFSKTLAGVAVVLTYILSYIIGLFIPAIFYLLGGLWYFIIITIIAAIILMIGYLMALFTEKKQALHDMIAGTLVVNK